MTQRDREAFVAVGEYLELQFQGFDDEMLEKMARRKRTLTERVRAMEGIDDIHRLLFKEEAPQIVEIPAVNPRAPAQEGKMTPTDTPTIAKPNSSAQSAATKLLTNSGPKRFLLKRKTLREEAFKEEPQTKEKRTVSRKCNASTCKFPDDDSDLLKCSVCNSKYHSRCLNPPLVVSLINREEWQCTECKVCKVCSQPTDETQLLICDLCDRAFHTRCHKPEISQIPDNHWYCTDCSTCRSCGKNCEHDKNESPAIIAKKSLYNDTWLLCRNCKPSFDRREFCPKCLKVIPENSVGNFIYCDMCLLWAHTECEGLDAKKFKELQSKKGASYVCLTCRQK
eukprot:TRINITY_DN4160_c0_g6_i1.p1 TRINITY_DN4160_c0_g6~~TRINITY_DN4160_c0_g6_i1.p1  ORF type:complete len:338 (-),score=35.08 TRINITY_DN4160_c0_g6_i1:19-1032(-)